jgi:hypothetical protein
MLFFFLALPALIAAQLESDADGVQLLQSFLESTRTREEPDRRNISLWVAIISAPENVDRREAIRRTWLRDVGNRGDITARFVVCTGRHKAPVIDVWHGDLLELPCEEGYARGLLTQKVRATMDHFLKHTDSHTDAFMKADDDSYVLLRSVLQRVRAIRSEHYYMGNLLDANQEPIRDPTHRWYEPRQNWPHRYPRCLAGMGYVVDRELLRKIIDEDWTKMPYKMLYNEDRATCIWIKYQLDQGRKIEYVEIPSQHDGPDHVERYETSFPKFIYHHLDPMHVDCLYKEMESNDDGSVTSWKDGPPTDRMRECK